MFSMGEKTANVQESNCSEAHTFSEEMCNWLLPRTLFSQIIFTLKPKLRLTVPGHCIMYSQRSEVTRKWITTNRVLHHSQQQILRD